MPPGKSTTHFPYLTVQLNRKTSYFCSFIRNNLATMFKRTVSIGFVMNGGTTEQTPLLDASDRLLVEALRRDARQSHRQLAVATGLSLGTVNRRIHRMEKDGVIRGYHAIIDPRALGYDLTVIVGLRIDKGFLRTVQRSIAEDARVFGVYDVTGEWDGFVLARLRNRQDLDDLVKSTLSMPHIQRTSTMVVLETVLEDAAPRPT